MKKVILCSDVELEASASIALLAQSSAIDLLGVVASAGRVSAEEASANAQHVLQKTGRDIPVLRGSLDAIIADLDPLRKNWEPAPGLNHGKTLRNVSLGDPREHSGKCGVIWMIDTLMRSPEKVILLMLGPLTDLALTLKVQPDIAAHIEEVVIVGGGYRQTDVSAAAEFNIHYDPEAAAIVFASPLPKTVIPLDCAHSALLKEKDLQKALSGSVAGILAMESLCRLFQRHKSVDEGASGLPFPMLLGAVYLFDPLVLGPTIPYRVDVDYSGGYAYGQTVFDTRRIFDNYNCLVSFSTCKKKLVECLRRLAEG